MIENKILLIDGNSYIHRAFHALPPLTDAAGQPVNAVYGFLRMLKKLINDENPTHILVAFDHRGPTFRHKEFAGYKAHRPETDEALTGQFKRLYPVLDSLNITYTDYEGFEADDIIGSYLRVARASNLKTVIVTGDKDMLQLLDDEVIILNGMTDKVYTKNNVAELFGVGAEYITDYLALVGDRSDNLPGVRGIGPVMAKKLIDEYGHLENIYENLSEIGGASKKKLNEGSEDAFTTRRLATIVRDLDLPCTISDLRWKGPDTSRLRKELKILNFRKLIADWVPSDDLKGVIKREIVYTSEELKAFLDEGEKESLMLEILSFGSETPAGISLTPGDKRACYIPLGHSYLGVPEQMDLGDILHIITEFIDNNTVTVDAYDFKEVYKFFRERGYFVSAGFDLLTADYLLSATTGGGTLTEIAGRYLDWSPSEYSGTEAEEDPDKASLVSSSRAAAVSEIKIILLKRLEEANLLALYENIELPMAKILAEMELSGIWIDKDVFKLIETDFKKKLRELEKEIFSAAGVSFNINSPTQLSDILFNKRGLKPVRKTKKGYSTAEDVLQKLSEEDPLPELILEYRHFQKLNSTYVEPLPKAADGRTGRIHTNFNIFGTATGRLSSTDPNLQNIPVRSEEGGLIREGFKPPGGAVFLSADYSQIDLRVMAHLSGDEALIESFNKGEDIHLATAARVFETPEAEVTKDMRNRAKAVNFGIVYGISGWGLSKNIDMSREESEAFIEKYFSRYPGVREYMDRVISDTRASGYVKTILGRIRRFPEINSKNYMRRSLAERAAINTPVQGSSADIIKKAMVMLDEKFSFNFNELKLILQIHDELLFEVSEDKAEEYIPEIREIMESALELSVPLKVDFKRGKNLRDLKSC